MTTPACPYERIVRERRLVARTRDRDHYMTVDVRVACSRPTTCPVHMVRDGAGEFPTIADTREAT